MLGFDRCLAIAHANFGVIVRLVRDCALGRTIEYSRGDEMIRRGRGVLDSPYSRGMTVVFGAAVLATSAPNSFPQHHPRHEKAPVGGGRFL